MIYVCSYIYALAEHVFAKYLYLHGGYTKNENATLKYFYICSTYFFINIFEIYRTFVNIITNLN